MANPPSADAINPVEHDAAKHASVRLLCIIRDVKGKVTATPHGKSRLVVKGFDDREMETLRAKD